MTRQSGAFIGLTAIVSFLLGLVVAGTRPPLARDHEVAVIGGRDHDPQIMIGGEGDGRERCPPGAERARRSGSAGGSSAG